MAGYIIVFQDNLHNAIVDMKIYVTFMSGAGNLFSVINNTELGFKHEQLSLLAELLCSKNDHNPNRTEGLLAISKTKDSFDVQFYNPDGSKDAMCGNGGRCAVSYAIQNSFIEIADGIDIDFTMAGDTYHSQKKGKLIKLFFPPPAAIKTNIEIQLGDESFFGDLIDVGSKHFVIPKNNIEKYSNLDISEIDLNNFAIPIRFHKIFQPNGINVSIYQFEKNNSIKLRTFERGVEAETGACGTGAISVAFSAVGKGKCNFPVRLIPPSGLELIVEIVGHFPDKIKQISLTGGAEVLDEYYVEIPDSLFRGKI
jgi:diaminopimelate epimerase